MLPASKMSVPRLCLTVFRLVRNVSLRAGFHIRQDVPHPGEVCGLRDALVACPVEHLRQLGLQRPDGPADGIAVRDRVHPAVHAHAAADPARGRQLRVLRSVDVASLEIEAVEPQQRSLLARDIGRHVDGYALVDMILDVAIPQLVPDDEVQGFGGEYGSR